MPELSVILRLRDEMSKELDKTVATLEKYKTQLRAVGMAMTGVGIGGLKLTDDARKLNAQLGMTAITMGTSTDAMRDMAMSTADASFPLKEVTATFELLARAGVRSKDQMVASAKAFDALADATNSSAEAVANTLIPAFKVFGIALPETTKELDKFTWLTHNTTIDLAEFGSVMQYVAMYGADLGITLDDMIGIMAALEARGISGGAATRLFRTAVNQAKEGVVTLNEALGVTQEQIDMYNDQIVKETGLTDKQAAAASSQFGIMDKLHSLWEKLTLRLGTVMAPLEAVFATMSALGPVMLFLSTQLGLQIAAWIAHKVVVVASTIAMIAAKAATIALSLAMKANPILLVAGAVIALGAALWGILGRNKEATDTTKAYTEQLGELFDRIKTEGDAAVSAIEITYKTMIAQSRSAGDTQKVVQLQFQLVTETLRAQMQEVADLTIVYNALVRTEGENTDKVKEQKRIINELNLAIENQKGEVDKLIESYQKLAVDSASNLRDWQDIQKDYYKEIATANANYIAEEKRLTDAYESELRDRTSALTDWVGLFDQIPEQTGIDLDTTSQYLSEWTDMVAGYYGEIAAANAAYIAEEKRLTNAYESQLEQRTSALMGWTKLFDDVPEYAAASGAALLQLLQRQVNWTKLWQINIASLAAKVPEGMLEELEKLGPDALPQLRALNSMTSGQLDKYVSLWETKHAIVLKEATNELADVKTETADAIAALKSELETKLSEIDSTWGEHFKTWVAGIPDISQTMIDKLTAGEPGFSAILALYQDAILTSLTSPYTTAVQLQATGIDTLISNLQGQVDQFTLWKDTITALAAKVPPAMLGQLQKLGPEALPQLLLLNSMTSGQLDGYVSLWQQKYALAAQVAADELAGLKADTLEQIAALKPELELALAEIDKTFGEHFLAWVVGVPDISQDLILKLTEGKAGFGAILAEYGTLVTDNLTKKFEAAKVSLDTVRAAGVTAIPEVKEIAPVNLEAEAESKMWADFAGYDWSLPAEEMARLQELLSQYTGPTSADLKAVDKTFAETVAAAGNVLTTTPTGETVWTSPYQAATGVYGTEEPTPVTPSVELFGPGGRVLYNPETGKAEWVPFQHGGIVTKPTLGMIGEAGPEAVIPLSRTGGMGSTYNITIQAGAFLGNRSDAEKFGDWIMQIVRKKQRLALGEVSF